MLKTIAKQIKPILIFNLLLAYKLFFKKTLNKVMNSSSDFLRKEVLFSLHPSAKKLSEIDILCFISSWSEQDYIEMQKGAFFKSWLLETSKSFSLGFLVFNIIYPELEILRIGIHPEWRRYGLAELMIDRLELSSKKKNLISIILDVHIDNKPALSLYRKKGFKDIGTRKNYFKNPLGDALLLKKFL